MLPTDEASDSKKTDKQLKKEEKMKKKQSKLKDQVLNYIEEI